MTLAPERIDALDYSHPTDEKLRELKGQVQAARLELVNVRHQLEKELHVTQCELSLARAQLARAVRQVTDEALGHMAQHDPVDLVLRVQAALGANYRLAMYPMPSLPEPLSHPPLGDGPRAAAIDAIIHARIAGQMLGPDCCSPARGKMLGGR